MLYNFSNIGDSGHGNYGKQSLTSRPHHVNVALITFQENTQFVHQTSLVTYKTGK